MTMERESKTVTRRNILLEQCRKPSGWLGRFILWRMNSRHSKSTDWGLAQVSIGKDDTILDVGCGGGRTLSKLAAIAHRGKGHVVDYSEQRAAAAQKNK